MNRLDIHELAGLSTVRPLPEDVEELLKNAAYVRHVQAITNTLGALYKDAIYAAISDTERAVLRGYIIALEQVLAIKDELVIESKNNLKRSKPDAEKKQQDGIEAFREKLIELKGTKHV